jgi:hypothetical protein
MIIQIDRIDRFDLISELPAPDGSGELRRYYVASAPYRALIVCRHGLALSDIQSHYVDASSGRDRGDPGFARIPGKPQSKLTIYRRVSPTATMSGERPLRLSQWLLRALKEREELP